MPVLVGFTPLTTFSVPFVVISSSGTPMVNKSDLLCLSSPDLPFTTCSVIMNMDLINISPSLAGTILVEDTEEERFLFQVPVCSSRQAPAAQVASALS